MPWVRLDDHFDEHPKIAQLDDHAFALFICGLAYCNRNLTDGFIPHNVGYGQLRWCDGNTVPAVRQLERTGLWSEAEGGWLVHDFGQYQPARQDVLKERGRNAQRARQRRTPAGSTGKVPAGHRPDITPDNNGSTGGPVPGINTPTSAAPGGHPPSTKPGRTTRARVGARTREDLPSELLAADEYYRARERELHGGAAPPNQTSLETGDA